MKKRIVLIILILAMVVLLFPQNSVPVIAAGTTRSVADFTELQNAVTVAADGDTIEITAPISITYVLTVTKSLTFIASGTGKITRDITNTFSSIFQVGDIGKTITFRDITLDGNGNVSSDHPGIIVLKGEVVFESGAVLQNCNSTFAAVYVNPGAKFTMNGGSITNNKTSSGGGGVKNYGSFTMNNGNITNNTASGDGGGVNNCGIFTMNGGIIDNNHAQRGGGVFITNGKIFTMTSGSIINNTVGNTGLGGGIETGSNSSVKLSGDVQISGNKKQDDSADNIYMEDSNTIELTGPLIYTTPIGVRMKTPGVFTSGTTVHNNDYISKFVSDDSAYTVQEEGSQLKLAAPPAYPVTITVHKDDIVWNDHGKSFKLVKSGTDYTVLTSIPNGTYDVYEGTTDTGVNVTVNNAAASATVDYYTVTLTAGEGITSTSGDGTYSKGSSLAISAVVTADYTWSKWTLTNGGAELSIMKNYTITNIQTTQSYTATAVNPPPTIGTIPEQSPVLTGSNLNDVLTKPVISAGAYTIASQGWICSADGSTNWNSIPIGSTCSTAINGYYLRYYVTYNDSGMNTILSPNTVQMTINRYTPSMTLSLEPASPQISGTKITLKASISGGTYMTNPGYLNTVPVIFKEGTNTLGTASISATTGIATFETTTLAVGDHSLTAEFPGDSEYNAPTTSSAVNYTITAAPAPAGSIQTTVTSTETKTITVIETPQRIPDKKLLTVEPVGDPFDKSVEVRLKEDPSTESMVHKAMESVSAAKTLENTQIFPLDISIYLKGTDTKVQPKEGTAVTITCPIPTEMLPNKDKLVVICIIDGELQVLPATLVLKNGVPCVQFTATHFSPYALVTDNDNKLADYAVGTLSDEATYISTKLTATAGILTKVELDGIKEGSAITYHVSTPTFISIDSNGNLFTKKAGDAILMARVTYDGATTVYTIHITVKKTKGGTKVGFIQYYNDIVIYNNINYRITTKDTDTTEGMVAVANNQINKNLPEKVVIPATITYKGKTYKVTSIDESAFYNVKKITSVTIPAGVEEISTTAFVSCNSLKTFTVSSDNKYYSAKKGMLLNKKGTLLIAYPSAKGSIVIDKKIKVIGAYAFSVCRYLTEVVIPITVTRIEGCAFAHSKSLTKVTFKSMTVPNIPYLCIFEKVNKACTIFVPENSHLKYQVALKNARMPKGVSVNGKK